MKRNNLANPAQGERLAKLRSSANLTQRQVADAVGVMPVTVSHWELGLCFPAQSRLLDLARLYGVATDELLVDEASA